MSSVSFPSLELACGPSWWLRSAVLLLGAAGVWAVLLSALPAPALALPLLLGVRGWRAASRLRETVQFGADGSVRLLPPQGVDASARRSAPAGDVALAAASGEPARVRRVHERGPLLVVSLRAVAGAAGRPRPLQHLCFGPDTASAAQRRLLRLWLQRHPPGVPDALLAGVR